VRNTAEGFASGVRVDKGSGVEDCPPHASGRGSEGCGKVRCGGWVVGWKGMDVGGVRVRAVRRMDVGGGWRLIVDVWVEWRVGGLLWEVVRCCCVSNYNISGGISWI